MPYNQGAIMNNPASAAGRFNFLDSDFSVNRMGYGAMQLAGAHVFGPPKNPDEARAVLREAIELGIDHIDTSDFYGPHVTNELIHETLYPYSNSLVLVTKIGFRRDEQGGWLPQHDEAFLRQSVEDNLTRLGLSSLAIVNLRMVDQDHDIAAPMRVMRAMQDEGLIKHIGISTVSAEQIAAARDIATLACVQNHYNLAHRRDDALIDKLAEAGIAYVPYFPLGGFSPLQSAELKAVAAEICVSAQSVALAWLLNRSPNILVIPGTSSRVHLRENVDAASIKFTVDQRERLNAI